jgi:hypothetical protein
MNYATRRMVEPQAPSKSDDSPLNPRQHPAATSQQEPAAERLSSRPERALLAAAAAVLP